MPNSKIKKAFNIPYCNTLNRSNKKIKMPSIFAIALLYVWDLLKIWASLFAAPFTNLEMLWIIIPTYLNWIFADFFQEKRGTSLGNAISNAAIILWVSIDWTRTSIRFFSNKVITNWHLASNIIVSIAVFLFGAWIVYDGIKGKNIIHHIGRIRIITYIVLMITPLVYASSIPIGKSIIAMIVFFPAYYYVIELLNHFLPDPVSIREGKEKSDISAGFDAGLSDINSQTGRDLKNQKFDDLKNFKL